MSERDLVDKPTFVIGWTRQLRVEDPEQVEQVIPDELGVEPDAVLVDAYRSNGLDLLLGSAPAYSLATPATAFGNRTSAWMYLRLFEEHAMASSEQIGAELAAVDKVAELEAENTLLESQGKHTAELLSETLARVVATERGLSKQQSEVLYRELGQALGKPLDADANCAELAQRIHGMWLATNAAGMWLATPAMTGANPDERAFCRGELAGYCRVLDHIGYNVSSDGRLVKV